MYKENPKTKGSGILACIPQTGRCPINCDDCFFQSGRSFLEPLEENLPNMPTLMESIGRVIRVNDGNDSNIQQTLVRESTMKYQHRFFNTCIMRDIGAFNAPVVLTINPGKMTDVEWHKLLDIPNNLMFVRIRTNTWNLTHVVIPAVEYYTENEVPVVLTFMAYYDTIIPKRDQHYYEFKKRTLNSYYVITNSAWEMIMGLFNRNKWVHSCGKNADTHPCKFCGNCLREYFSTSERMRL